MFNPNTIANIVATIAITVAGFFATHVNSLTDKVNSTTNKVTGVEARAGAQYEALDKRLTRIEDTLDRIDKKL